MCPSARLLPMMSRITITSYLSVTETLIGSNFKKRKHDAELVIGLIVLIMCFLEDKPVVSTIENSQGVQTKLEKLERAQPH